MMVINEKEDTEDNSIISKDGEYVVTCYTYRGAIEVRFTTFEDAVVWAHDNKGVLSCPYCEDLDYTENNKYYNKEEEMETTRTMHERRRKLEERIASHWLNAIPTMLVGSICLFAIIIGSLNAENLNMIVAGAMVILFIISWWLVITMKVKTNHIEVEQHEELKDVEDRINQEINAKPIIIRRK
jgi:hypothetical protein